MNSLVPVETQSFRPSVTQDNALISAAYAMTLNEKRLLLLGISKVNPLQFPRKDQPLEFEITTDEWCQYYPTTNAYREMKGAAEQLQSRYVVMRKRRNGEERVNWTDKCVYIESEGRVSIRFGWTISLYIAGMVDQFTRYDLLSVSKLTSVHAIRIYELCMQFKSTGYRRIAVDELRDLLQLGDAYPLFANFRARVLDVACRTISEKTDYELRYSLIKEGRSVRYIEFFMEQRKQLNLEV